MARRRAERVLVRLQPEGRAKGRALSAWAGWCAARAHAMATLETAVLRMGSQAMARGFHGWLARRTAARHAREAMGRAAMRLAHVGLARAWAAWTDEGGCGREQAMRRAAVSMADGGAARRSFNSWADAAAERARLADCCAFWYPAAPPRHMAFDRWADYVAIQRWRRSCAAAGQAGHRVRMLRLVVEGRSRRLLRRTTAAWARYAMQWGLRRRSAKLGPRRAVWFLLSPDERSAWPKAWQDFFGWRPTWRDLREWLTSLRAPSVAVPKSHAGLVTALQQGHIYCSLIARVSTPAPAAAGAPRGGGLGPPPKALSAAVLNPQQAARASLQLEYRGRGRDECGGWRHLLSGLFASELAANALGEAAHKLVAVSGTLGLGGGVPNPAPALLDHLRVLAALRALDEMRQPELWAPFVASISGASPSEERIPTLTPRHAFDDYSACVPGAQCDAVCLGCPTPRILVHGVRCGRCGLTATLPVGEYSHMFSSASSLSVRTRDDAW